MWWRLGRCFTRRPVAVVCYGRANDAPSVSAPRLLRVCHFCVTVVCCTAFQNAVLLACRLLYRSGRCSTQEPACSVQRCSHLATIDKWLDRQSFQFVNIPRENGRGGTGFRRNFFIRRRVGSSRCATERRASDPSPELAVFFFYLALCARARVRRVEPRLASFSSAVTQRRSEFSLARSSRRGFPVASDAAAGTTYVRPNNRHRSTVRVCVWPLKTASSVTMTTTTTTTRVSGCGDAR